MFRKNRLVLTTAVTFVLGTAPLQAQDTKPKLDVIRGPAKAQLGAHAQIEVPEGYVFLGGDSYRKMLKAEGEPVNGDEVGFLKQTNQDWALLFEFSDVGYVKDDEKDKLDADKLLESIKRGTAEANKTRARAGNPPIEVVGWEMRPKYDETSHNLEWAIRGQCEGRQILNYNTRLLGRRGVMSVVLIVEPEKLAATLPTLRDLLTKYSYGTGETYAEYKPGDKMAKYGLGALVVGGAAVGAAKLGLFAWLAVLLKKAGKALILVVIAVVAFCRKLLGRLFGGRTEPGGGPSS